MTFGNIVGLYALLALVPFLLIYLIRPKSFEKIIPSLMFITQERHKFQKASFLQKLLRNLLLIIQILIILFLAFSVASPSLEVPHSVLKRNTVIVLDASASMQAKEGTSTRFEKALHEAKGNLGLKNAIILAENAPIILLEEGSAGEASSLLNKLKPRATSTNLGDAVLLAADLLGEKKGIITVVSDFIATEGSDLLMAKRTLSSRGHAVNFIDVSNDADNVGIVDIIIDKEETIVEIKNFKDEDIQVTATLNEEGTNVDKKKISLSGMSKERIEFETPKGASEITLDINDDFNVDNVAYISSPQKKSIKILLITNFQSSSRIKAALRAIPNIDLEIREPPTINAYNIDHDIVIINDITKKLFVPSDFRDIKRYVEKGGVLIIAGQENLGEIDTLDLLPLNIENKEDKSTSVCADVVGSLFPKDPYADEPCFGSLSKYLKGTAKNGTTVIASAQLDNSPVIMHMKMELGDVLYYGIIDKYSGFYSDPFYPVFWNNIVNYLMKTEDIKEYNFKTGKTMIINEQEVKTPTAKVTTNKLLLDEAGFYELDNKKIAVNLANEIESDISRENLKLTDELKKFSSEKVKDTDIIDLEVPLLLAALIILFLEFIYIKRRGDF